MAEPLIAKLEQFTKLSSQDKAALAHVANEPCRQLQPGQDLIREGDNPENVKLVLDGWACRYKQLEDGRRQIIAFFLPGDLCDTHVYVLREMDHSIGALSPLRYVEIDRQKLEAATSEHARLAHALWWDTLVTAAVQREWTVNLGQRDAVERLGHLFCELFTRLRGIGLTEGDTCPMPVNQQQLGDAMGVTSVHVNRSLQELRGNDLIVLKRRQLTIPDFDALQAFSLFNPNYLHLGRIGRHLDANEV